MIQPARGVALTAQLIVSIALLWSAPASTADLHDEMSGRWFVTEVIVFERPRVGLLHGGEPLLSEVDWQWQEDMHLIRRASPEGATLDGSAYRERDNLQLRASDAQPEEPDTAQMAASGEGDWRSQLSNFEAELAEQGPVWLEPTELTMTSHRRDIERRLGASILFHGAWRQDVPGREEPYPIMLPDAGVALFGIVSVTVNRYLHVSADLNFPVTGLAVIDEGFGPTHANRASTAEASSTELDSTDAEQPRMQQVSGVMRMSESRRVRSEELHYLDHPRFGVLLRIQEISFPESLEAAWRERSR